MKKIVRIFILLVMLIGHKGFAQSSLIHYWNFNGYTKSQHTDTIRGIAADYSTIDTAKAKVLYKKVTGTSTAYSTFIDSVSALTADYDTVNTRLGAPAGIAIRVRNPSDSMQLLFYIPTTHYKNIVLKYGSESSSLSHGQKHQVFDYSIDSGATWRTSGLSLASDSAWLVFHRTTVSLATDTMANNNPKLVFRIKFSGNTTVTSGNNRFDNITVEGDTMLSNTIAITTSSTTICTGTSVHFSSSVSFGSGITPSYQWMVNSTIVGSDSIGFTTNTLHNGDTVVCYLKNGVGGSVIATSNFIIMSVSTLPVVSAVTGANNVYIGGIISLSDSAGGGTWSSSNANASVTGSIVTGMVAGLDTITYTVSNICGAVVATKVVSIYPLPSLGSLIHYWNFNNYTLIQHTDTIHGIAADYSRIDTSKAKILYKKITGTSSVYATTIDSIAPSATDYDTVNLRMSAPTGFAIRVRNPSDSMQLLFYIPTTHYKNITLQYASESSSLTHGQTHQMFDYSIDSGATWRTSGLSIPSDSGWLHFHRTIITFPTDVQVINNPKLVFRIKFQGNDTGTSGNNRFDNVTVEGDTIISTTATIAITSSLGSVICAGNTVNYTATAVYDSTITPYYQWSINGVNMGTDTNVFASSTLHNGDSVKCILENGIGGAVLATSNIIVMNINPSPTAGSIIGASSVCMGANIILTDSITGGIWSSSNTLATVSGGIVTGGTTAGVDTISYTVSNSCGSATTRKIITINLLPNIAPISGGSTMCVATTLSLTDSITGGAWTASNSNATVTAGAVTSVAAGADTIMYARTNTCGTATVSKIITILNPPTVSVISGLTIVCTSYGTTLTDSITGGVWSCSNSNATVSSGYVTGITAGLDTITYTVTNICGSIATTKTITINASGGTGNAGVVLGASNICGGDTVTYTDTILGGTWSMSNGHAMIVSADSIVGISTGIDTLSYSISNTCGTVFTSKTITINVTPVAGFITGTSMVCTGSSITLIDTIAMGTWAVSNSKATIDSGMVTGNLAGIDTISYTVANYCGIATATKTITINTMPTSIIGDSTVCAGLSITLSDSVAGAVWTSSATSIATINTFGRVLGISAGTATITYNNGGCMTMKSITVNALPIVGSIMIADSLCAGTTTMVLDSVMGGTWALSNSNATVDTGIITAMFAGVDTISYTTTSAYCGSATITKTITINPLPFANAISGLDSMCAGTVITLTDAVSGGTWMNGNTNTTVSVGGIVTAISAGYDTIMYKVTNGCGSDSVSKIVKINALPSAGVITGLDTVCIGGTITLTDAAMGGVWSVVNTNVSILPMSTSVIVMGATSGIDAIKYIVTNSCGTDSNFHAVFVNTMPSVAAITGMDSVCTGSSITLADATMGGMWNASNTINATVVTGIVTGLVAGIDTIKYSLGNACGTTTKVKPILIIGLPNAGGIMGNDSVCTGTSITLSDTVMGGVWTIKNSNATHIDSIVTGVNAGMDTLYYTVTNTCNFTQVMHPIFIISQPYSSEITGGNSVCVGDTTRLMDSVAGGSWSTADVVIGLVDTVGVVYGVSSGIDSIHYTVANTCGSATKSFAVTIVPKVVPHISCGNYVCMGSRDSLISLGINVSGGVWTTTNANLTIVNGDTIAALHAGMDTIYYTISNVCGTLKDSAVLTINTKWQCDSLNAVSKVAINNEMINVYPNPSEGHFTIEVPQTLVNATLSIIDIYGKIIETRYIENNVGFRQEFNLKNIASGIYIIKLNWEGNSYYKKVIVR